MPPFDDDVYTFGEEFQQRNSFFTPFLSLSLAHCWPYHFFAISFELHLLRVYSVREIGLMKSEYGSSIFVYEFAFSRAIRYGSRAPNALAQIAFSMQKKIKMLSYEQTKKTRK